MDTEINIEKRKAESVRQKTETETERHTDLKSFDTERLVAFLIHRRA